MKSFFTSESVTEGHPDKVCDQIADGILDAILQQDPMARVAIECCAAYDLLLIMGEVTSSAKVNYEEIARSIIKEIGYDFGTFSYDNCKIQVSVHEQSADIAMGVNNSVEEKNGGAEEDSIGAGDQGLMFGYACRETKELMPLPIMLAHKLAKELADVRKSGELKYLRPDGKTQVTVEYDGKKAVRIDTVVVSTQHDDTVTQEQLKEDIKNCVIDAVLPNSLVDEKTKYYINPTGRFEIGGPEGDSGLTGRKIIVDTYGGRCAHGGGSFSGKDATKVDRSATYMARYICKNIVEAKLADEIELQVAYAIGVANPVSVFVNTFGTGKISDEKIATIIKKEFDLRPYSIIKKLNLRMPIYKNTAAYGHFGKAEFPWEDTSMAEGLKIYLPEEKEEDKFAERRGYGDRDRKSFGDRDRKPFGDRDRKPFGDRDRKPFGDRDRKPFGDRDRKPYGDRDRKPYGDRGGKTFDKSKSEYKVSHYEGRNDVATWHADDKKDKE